MSKPLPATLCDLCRSYFRDIEGKPIVAHFSKDGTPLHDKNYRLFHQDNAALRKSLDQCCSLCNALGYDTNTFERDEVTTQNDYGFRQIMFRCWPQARLSIGDRVTITSDRHFLRLDVKQDSSLLQLSQDACLASSTGDSTCLELASEWMHRCMSSHSACRRHSESLWYPTRLLDIQNDIVRLVENRNQRLTGPYATLSHQWGTERIKVLTEESLPEFETGILLDDIPETFSDAVRVARHMSIPYLWIDCYCIIQSEGARSKDKEREIAQMGEVYSHAILNIGAAAARSPLDGLFVRRVPKSPIRIDAESTGNADSPTYLLFDEAQLSAEVVTFTHSNKNSVFRRGWCMQERVLSPRMLHFCESGVFWECAALGLASDYFPLDFLTRNHWNKPAFSISARDHRRISAPVLATPWDRVVEAYSAMELSRPTEDKLDACGGVAKAIAELKRDEYVAGFFRQDLIKQLTWTGGLREIGSTAPPTMRAKKWQAPSWSWASMDGPVEIMAQHHANFEVCAHVVAIDCKLKNPLYPYGALAAGKITLKGWVADLDLQPHPSTRELLPDFIEWRSPHFKFDDASEPRKGLIIFLTLLATNQWLPLYGHAYGLVLAKVNKPIFSRHQLYKRVGAFLHTQLPKSLELKKKVVAII